MDNMDSWRDSVIITDESSEDSDYSREESSNWRGRKKNIGRIIDSNSETPDMIDSTHADQDNADQEASALVENDKTEQDAKADSDSDTLESYFKLESSKFNSTQVHDSLESSADVFYGEKTELLPSATISDSIKNEPNSVIIDPTPNENSKFDQLKEESNIVISDSDSDDQQSPLKLPFTKPNLTLKQTPIGNLVDLLDSPESKAPPKQEVSRLEFVNMKQKLEEMYTNNRRLEQAFKTIDLNTLPDKGESLLQKQRDSQDQIKEQERKLGNIVVKNDNGNREPSAWKGIEQAATQVQPRTFGKHAMETYNNEKALTLDRLHILHSSMKTCPTPETLADDPQGLKVELMVHQKHALAWLQWREFQKPAGGVLADDMGLGKTLTMLSLICATMQREADEEDHSDDDEENDADAPNCKYKGGTLVVCPASLLSQWVKEIEDKLCYRMLSVETYHGPKRETKAKRLSKYDVVVTTYAICQSEGGSESPLYRIKWDRVILDEAHQIRNHKSKTSLAVFRLAAKRRWALTGTPVHNKELDLFALLKFLRCSPFDDIVVFKRWISQKATGGNERLHTVLSSLLLRRTKEQLQEMKQLNCLPEREWKLLEVQMDKDEMQVYQKILLFSKTLFAQYLHQRAEKNADNIMHYNEYNINKINDPSNEYYKMHKKLVRMNKLPEVKSSDILVLLLRLRQICCHPSLITAMLDNVADLGEDVEDADVSMNLLDQLNNLSITDDAKFEGESHPADGISANAQGVGLAEASRGLLNPANPIFEKQRISAKLRAVLALLENDILSTNDKVIIVSQWTSYLHLLMQHLDALNVKYCQLDGSIKVSKRGEIVASFNNPRSDIRIMLLSLTAGGVGLNLVGANHLIFLDLHWNPQLEMQAQDRIYRLGQKKKVNIYKFMTVQTIEERIKNLQDSKLLIADAMLKGAKMQHTKLSLDDLKMLFNM